jgi:hypothetical protein
MGRGAVCGFGRKGAGFETGVVWAVSRVRAVAVVCLPRVVMVAVRPGEWETPLDFSLGFWDGALRVAGECLCSFRGPMVGPVVAL